MTPIGAVLAILVVLEVEGYEIQVRSASTSTSPLRGPSSPASVDPREIVDAIESIETTSDPRGMLPTGRLPGFGALKDRCDDYWPYFCAECGNTITSRRRCDKSSCPACASYWVRNYAERLGAKVGQYRLDEDRRRDVQVNYQHYIVSIPKDFYFAADDGRDRAFAAVKDIMAALDIQGVVIYHPYRGAGEDLEGAVYNPSDDRGEWKRRLFKQRPWNASQRRRRDDLEGRPVRDELEYGPHFHVIGAGPGFYGDGLVDEVQAETGWVIKRVTQEGSKVSLFGEAELARALCYSLSHVHLYRTEESVQSAARQVGNRFYHHTDVHDSIAEQWRRIAREAAVDTLGIPYIRQFCQETDTVREEAGVPKSSHVTSPGGSGGDVPSRDADAAREDLVDDLEATGDEGAEVTYELEPEEPCDGILEPISKAPSFLNDEEWCNRVPLDRQQELRETYLELARDVDFLDPDRLEE